MSNTVYINSLYLKYDLIVINFRENKRTQLFFNYLCTILHEIKLSDISLLVYNKIL